MLALLEEVGAKTWLIIIGCLGLAIGLLAYHHTAYKEGVQTCASASANKVIAAQPTIQTVNTTLETETLDVQKQQGYSAPVSPLVGAALDRLRGGKSSR